MDVCVEQHVKGLSGNCLQDLQQARTHSPSSPSLSCSGLQIPQILPTRLPLFPSQILSPQTSPAHPPKPLQAQSCVHPSLLGQHVQSWFPLGFAKPVWPQLLACLGLPALPSQGCQQLRGFLALRVTSRPLPVQAAAADTQAHFSKPWAAWESLVSQGSLQPSL